MVIGYFKLNLLSAKCDTELDDKLSETQIKSVLAIRDVIIDENENKRSLDQFAEINETLIDDELSKLSFIERYRLYMGPTLLNESTYEGRFFQHGPFYLLGGLSFYNGIKLSRKVAEDFVKRHQTTSWPTPFYAKRKFMDNLISKAFLGGIRRSLPISCVAYGLVALPTFGELYMNRSLFWSYGVTGASLGSLYCFFRGPAAMLTGGLLLGVPSFAVGVLVHHFRQLSNQNIEENLRIKMKHHLELQESIKCRGLRQLEDF